MVLSIVLCLIANLMYVAYFVGLSLGLMYNTAQDFLTVLSLFDLAGIILSPPAIVWDYNNIKNNIKIKGITGLVFALVALTLFVIYFVLRFVANIHAAGKTVF